MNKFLTIILTTLCLGACAPKHNDYSRFENIDTRGWAYGDTITIRPQGLDSVAPRQLSLAIRHNNRYEFRNLWLEVTYGDRRHMLRDTFNLDLADIYGRWHGKGLGPSYQYELTIAPRTNISDSSIVYIRHVMRVDTLKGIEQVGITVSAPPVKQTP